MNNLHQQLAGLPESPGVYIYRNEQNRVLYVGKAINLKNRVSSYFTQSDLLGTKTRALVQKIDNLEYIKVENEVEALLLEADLIKRYKPPYNIELKDDKFYKYIKVEYEALDGKKIYKITTSRKKEEENSKAKYFGPYPDASSVGIIVKALRKIFPFRDCSQAKFTRYKKAKRPCLYGYIGVCPAPCQTDEAIETNNENIKKFVEYLQGDRKKLFQRLEVEMKEASKAQNFEKAAVIRDQLASYQYLTQPKRAIREYIEKPKLIDDEAESSVEELIQILNREGNFKLSNEDLPNFRIEIFDISNFQGKNPVGSMVVLTGGIPDKSQYRRFKIRSKDTPDDFSMMAEMLSRRFAKRKGEAWPEPNLIVIDGGKGQLSTAQEVFTKKDVQIPSIGLAKRLEEIVIAESKGYKMLLLPENNRAINLLKKGRDEAHRYGITYYRKLHRQAIYKTSQPKNGRATDGR